jgi:hypothetical protein
MKDARAVVVSGLGIRRVLDWRLIGSDRMVLVELLAGGREVLRLCGSALTGGAGSTVGNEPTSTRELASIYSRRMRTMARRGQSVTAPPL